MVMKIRWVDRITMEEDLGGLRCGYLEFDQETWWAIFKDTITERKSEAKIAEDTSRAH